MEFVLGKEEAGTAKEATGRGWKQKSCLAQRVVVMGLLDLVSGEVHWLGAV